MSNGLSMKHMKQNYSYNEFGYSYRFKKLIFYLSTFSLKEILVLLWGRKKNKAKYLILKPKQLAHPVKIRNIDNDVGVFAYVLWKKFHLPPRGYELSNDGIILDLGVNIGLSVAHYKTIYPENPIIGYEMDASNFEIAKHNTRHYKNVQLFNKAVWIKNIKVSYNKDSRFDSFSIDNEVTHKNVAFAQGLTIRDIISQHSIDNIEFLKMDIEGAEKAIFNEHNKDWLKIVKSFNIEFHLDKDENLNDYIKIFEGYKFKVWQNNQRSSCLGGIKLGINEKA